MQVMCTTPFPIVGDENVPFPAVMDIDTVTVIEQGKGYSWYELRRFGKEFLYRADHFAILPEKDAGEIEDAEKEVIIPAPALYGNEHTH
jgi:hypothetical protein